MNDRYELVTAFLRSRIPPSEWPSVAREALAQNFVVQREVVDADWRALAEWLATTRQNMSMASENLSMAAQEAGMHQLLRNPALTPLAVVLQQRMNPSTCQLSRALGLTLSAAAPANIEPSILLSASRERDVQREQLRSFLLGRAFSSRLYQSVMEIARRPPPMHGHSPASERTMRLDDGRSDWVDRGDQPDPPLEGRRRERSRDDPQPPRGHDQSMTQLKALESHREEKQSERTVTAVAPIVALAPAIRLPGSNQADSFPIRIYRMIVETEAAGLSHIVSFTCSGRAFKIHKPEEFMRDVASQYFQYKHYPSFKRQLNLYGFARIPRGPEEGAYTHRNLCRGRPDLATLIRKASDDPDARKEWKPEFNFLDDGGGYD